MEEVSGVAIGTGTGMVPSFAVVVDWNALLSAVEDVSD